MTGNQSLIELQAQIFAETRAAQQPSDRLFGWLIDRRNLAGAWQRVATAPGSRTPGLDGLTCRDVRRDLNAWL